MNFKFDASQQFQLEAIASVVAVFTGQARFNGQTSLAFGATVPAVGNSLTLSDATLLENVRAVQGTRKLPKAEKLELLPSVLETVEGKVESTFPNFSIDMETGTGKTYVYLRTALELSRQYGWRKYIVVVPSVAIREGVLSSLELTKDHFRVLYNAPYHFFKYDSNKLSELRQFAVSDAVEIMVMTLDSFNKDSNIIRQPTDMLQGETPLHLIQSTRPIVIMDEPQNMESDLSKEALGTLSPLMTLRYSATHRVPYNRLFRLSPFDAYRQGLVKKIEVASVLKAGDGGNAFVELIEIKSSSRIVKAKVNAYVTGSDGRTSTKAILVSPGENLKEKTRNASYNGIIIEEINPSGFIRLSDRRELSVGETIGADKEAIFEAQLRYMVEEHFRKQARMRSANMKVLSLCFIDTVANYVNEDAIIPMLFDKVFNEVKRDYPEWKDIEPARVRIAYFAKKRRKDGTFDLMESTGQKEEDAAAFNLIMRDKAGLLSFDEPAAFIFSHSALREGWDSPNVFQICTLNQTTSEIKKRQEVGRGVRLPVNQSGDRISDERLNVLTVIANQSYESYVDSLQQEIIEEFGEEGTPPKPPDARKRRQVVLQKNRFISPEFAELWKRISEKTRYRLTIDTPRLIEEASRTLRDVEVKSRRIEVAKAQVQATANDEFVAARLVQPSVVKTLESIVPELLSLIAELLQFSSPPIRISRSTILQTLVSAESFDKAIMNGSEFASFAAGAIRDALASQIAAGIVYERVNEHYEMSLYETSFESWEQYLIPSPNALYDHVVFESDVEKQFVQDLELRDDVKLYVKLPPWFEVTTPVGGYNPDWAIVLEERDAFGKATGGELLYLVRETKSTLEHGNLRRDEGIKLECGAKHFKALQVPYKVVTSIAEM